jgi:hypothetical protein
MVTTSQSCKTFLRSANCPDGEWIFNRPAAQVFALGRSCWRRTLGLPSGFVCRRGCPGALLAEAGANVAMFMGGAAAYSAATPNREERMTETFAAAANLARLPRTTEFRAASATQSVP